MTPITEKSIGLDGKVFPDRRSVLRHRVLKGARLSFNRGFGALECVVRNLSPRGARLSLGDTFAVPATFDILIAGDTEIRPARVRWRSALAIGIEFD